MLAYIILPLMYQGYVQNMELALLFTIMEITYDIMSQVSFYACVYMGGEYIYMVCVYTTIMQNFV